MALPVFIKRPLMQMMFKDPHRAKETAGTVLLTAVGMFGEGGGWGIPLIMHTLGVTLGGIAEKPVVIDGQIKVRECLSLTVSFDHDIIDGAPAARFTQRFKDLIERGTILMTKTWALKGTVHDTKVARAMGCVAVTAA